MDTMQYDNIWKSSNQHSIERNVYMITDVDSLIKGKDVVKNISKILKTKRNNLGLNQEEFCGKVMSTSKLSKIESGDIVISVADIIALCIENALDPLEIFKEAMPNSFNKISNNDIIVDDIFITKLNKFTRSPKDKYGRSMIELMRNACECVFISGINMNNLHFILYELTYIPDSVSLNIALPSEKTIGSLVDYFGNNEIDIIKKWNIFHDTLNKLKSKRDVNIYYLDIFIPFTYVAVDYRANKDSSFLYVSHYLFSVPEIDVCLNSYIHLLKPEMELYKYHANRILAIEKYEGKLSERFEIEN